MAKPSDKDDEGSPPCIPAAAGTGMPCTLYRARREVLRWSFK